MTAADLYENLKDTLKFFDLRFCDMDLVHVDLTPTGLRYSYQGTTVTHTIPKEPTDG